MTPPWVTVAHCVQGRTRLRIPERKGDAAYFAEVRETLLADPHVLHVRTSPRTGSLLAVHERAPAALLESGEQRGLWRCEQASDARAAPTSPVQAIVRELDALDARVQRASEGRWSLKSIIATGFAGAGLWQARRGFYFPAASSLFSKAVTLLYEAAERERRGRLH